MQPNPDDLSVPDHMVVSSRCVVVVRRDGLSIQQSVWAPPWPLDVAQLELLAAIDLAVTDDLTDVKLAVAERSGCSEQHLNEFLFRLGLAGLVITDQKARHAPAPDAPSVHEPTVTTTQDDTAVVYRVSVIESGAREAVPARSAK